VLESLVAHRLIDLSGEWHLHHHRQIQQIERLEERLETVQEIRDDSGLFSSKIEELAEEKLRHREPVLAKERDASLKAERLEMAQELFATKELSLEQELGRSIDR
jgi:hypothetical protein